MPVNIDSSAVKEAEENLQNPHNDMFRLQQQQVKWVYLFVLIKVESGGSNQWYVVHLRAQELLDSRCFLPCSSRPGLWNLFKWRELSGHLLATIRMSFETFTRSFEIQLWHEKHLSDTV